MNIISLFAISILALPVVDKHNAESIQKSLNQGVELLQPDVQKIENLQVLAGGKTSKGDYLYVCEGDLVWLIGRKEYLERYQKIAKGIPLGALGAELAKSYLPHFKKGELINKVRVRARFEEAGGDLIVSSAKIVHFDLGYKSITAKSSDK